MEVACLSHWLDMQRTIRMLPGRGSGRPPRLSHVAKLLPSGQELPHLAPRAMRRPGDMMTVVIHISSGRERV